MNAERRLLICRSFGPLQRKPRPVKAADVAAASRWNKLMTSEAITSSWPRRKVQSAPRGPGPGPGTPVGGQGRQVGGGSPLPKELPNAPEHPRSQAQEPGAPQEGQPPDQKFGRVRAAAFS